MGKIPLPKEYFVWLKSIPDFIEYSDREWCISSLSELEESVNIDGMKTPSWKQLSSYLTTYQQVTGENHACDQNGKKIPLERLRKCITIGDYNGDPLFIDPSDKFSVWCYHHDGGDVEKLAPSLKDFTKGARPVDD